MTGAGKGIGTVTGEGSVRAWRHGRGRSAAARLTSPRSRPRPAATLAVDLADAKATHAAARQAQPIDLLVNNAGTTTLEPFLETSVASFDHIMAVNARAPMIVAQERARGMIERGVKELGPHGIRVNGVNPVVTLTPMAEKAWRDPDKAGAMLARIPLGRFVQPHEIADVV